MLFSLLVEFIYFLQKIMQLKKNKIFTIDKYIDEALYNKKSGYYMKVNPFGKKGDYITSPNISVLFSEIITIWTVLFWKKLKSRLDNEFPEKDILWNLVLVMEK